MMEVRLAEGQTGHSPHFQQAPGTRCPSWGRTLRTNLRNPPEISVTLLLTYLCSLRPEWDLR